MTKKIDAGLILNLIYTLYAFTLPLSRASAPIATVLIVLIFIFSPTQRRQAGKLWQLPAARWIIIFIGYYFLSLLITTTPGHSLEQWKEGLRYLIPYLYLLPAGIIAVTLKKRYLVMIFSAFLAGMLISELLSYLIFFGLWEKKRLIVSVANPTPFMHHIQYGTFLALTGLMLLSRVIRERRRWYQFFYALFFLLVIGTLFLINSRTGQAAFLIGLFVLAFAQFQNKIKALAISLLLAAVVVGSAYTLSDNFRGRVAVARSDIVNMLDKNNYQTSLGYRVGVMILSMPLIEKHPLFGTGVVDTMPLIRDGAYKYFADDNWLKHANHLQNQYLQVLVEAGLIGFSLLLMMFYSIASIPIQSQDYRNLKLVFVSIYLFTMLSDIQLHIQFTAGLFALIAGILLARSRMEREESDELLARTSQGAAYD